MSLTNNEIQAIVQALSSIRSPATPGEYDLHAEVSSALTKAQIEHQHEFRLAPHCRIDFLVGRIGIEVKKGRPAASALKKQIARYLECEQLDGIVVVVQHSVILPRTMLGKPVELLSLNRLWGVALP